MDTRINLGGTSVSDDGTRLLTVTAVAGVPTKVNAVVLTATVASPTTSGYLVVHPNSAPTPPTSTLNFPARLTVANLTITAPGIANQVAFHTNSAGKVGLIADIVGYFVANAA